MRANEVYIPSAIASDGESVDLGDDFDHMMRAPASSMSPLPALHNEDIQEEDDLVDYNDETVEEQDVLKGLDSDSDNSLVGGLSANAGQPPGSKQGKSEVINLIETAPPVMNTPGITQPVLTQKGLMEIISQQSSNVMQVQGWEQKKKC
jgi:hypothetical protein